MRSLDAYSCSVIETAATISRHELILAQLPYWDRDLEPLLTYRLSPEQIKESSSAASPRDYSQWVDSFLKNGWSSNLFAVEDFPNRALRSYHEKKITLHEFFTGMLFYAANRQENVRVLGIKKIDPLNIDAAMDRDFLPLSVGQTQEFRRRLLALPWSEQIMIEVEKTGNGGHVLDLFSWEGKYTASRPTDAAILHPSGTRIERTGKHSLKTWMLSSSIHQILSDIVFREDSVQAAPVIGPEDSFDLVNALRLGGRSVTVPFPNLETFEPHHVDPKKFPLDVMLHDFYHNETASHTSAKIRKEAIPYFLELARTASDQQFLNFPLPFAWTYTQQRAEGDKLEVRRVQHRITSEGIEDTIEFLTDLENPNWSPYVWLEKMAYPSNLEVNPFNNSKYRIDQLALVVVYLRDYFQNQEKWREFGFTPEDYSELREASYRFDYIATEMEAGRLK